MHIVFCHTTEDLGGEAQGNFTKDPTLYKTTLHSAATLVCSLKEWFGSGTAFLTRTKHLESNDISLSNQKPSVS